MHILIVEGNPHLGGLWKRHLERQGKSVLLVHNQADAIETLRTEEISIIVLDVVIEDGSAFAVADYASYRFPEMKVVFVTSSSFFSDGSIFQHVPNACAYVPTTTEPEDLAAVVDHYAARD